MSADVCAELVGSVQTMIASDTGAGGLSNTDSSAYVRHVFRYAAPELRTYNWPALILIPDADHFDTLRGSSNTRGGAVCSLSAVVLGDRDRGQATVNAVLGRLRTVLHRQTPAAGTAWEFSPLRIVAVRHVEPTGKELRSVVELRVLAARLAGGL